MVSRYLPVVENYAERYHVGGEVYWNRGNPFFYYPYIFVSPFVCGFKSKRSDFQKPEYKNDDLTIYADSGGFQISVKHEKVSVLDVLRWQEGIADIAFTVDIPAYSYRDEAMDIGKKFMGYPKNYFKKCLRQSVENAELMMSAKENEKMQLWAVLQGRNLPELLEWYKEITKNYEFDGYCVAVTAAINNVEARGHWISQLAVTHYIDTNIHFLGRCEPLIALVLAKLSSITGKDYTYDSSTTAGGFRFGTYIEPYFASSYSLSKFEEKRVKINGLPCDCPVCSQRSIEDFVDTKNGHLVYMHNTYMKIRFDKYVNSIVTDDDLFELTLKKLLSTSRYSLEFRRLMEEKILDIVYNEVGRLEKSMVTYF